MGVIDSKNIQSAVMTGGLVGNYKHTVLPSVSPLATLILTGMFIMVR